jgi:opacity protein-like surface antigen
MSTSSINNVNTGLVNLAAGYNFGINESYVLGIAATYYPGASSSATGVLSVNQTTGNPAYNGLNNQTTATYNVKNLYSIVLTPGYVIDKDRLAYAKVGYTGATIGLSSPILPYSATNLSGIALGLGYKQMVTSGLYGFVEGNYMGYSAPSYSNLATTRAHDTLHGIGSTGTRTVTYNFASLNTFQALVGLGYAF